LHWVSVGHAVDAEVRLYEHLFTREDPNDVGEGGDWHANIRSNSREILSNCKVEPALKGAKPLSRIQLERLGYFCIDPDSTDAHPVLNRTVTLRDTWAKIQKAQQQDA
jgi:glutaminyl-tRNA synthetase